MISFGGSVKLGGGDMTEDYEAPIVWADPRDIKRTMIASFGETEEVSANKEGRFSFPLYMKKPEPEGSIEYLPTDWKTTGRGLYSFFWRTDEDRMIELEGPKGQNWLSLSLDDLEAMIQEIKQSGGSE